MSRRSRFPMLIALLLLGACSKPAEIPAPPLPAKNVFDPLTQQLDRARAVQGVADQNGDETRKKIDAGEGSDASR